LKADAQTEKSGRICFLTDRPEN